VNVSVRRHVSLRVWVKAMGAWKGGTWKGRRDKANFHRSEEREAGSGCVTAASQGYVVHWQEEVNARTKSRMPRSVTGTQPDKSRLRREVQPAARALRHVSVSLL
jgi:hypothetical protein